MCRRVRGTVARADWRVRDACKTVVTMSPVRSLGCLFPRPVMETNEGAFGKSGELGDLAIMG